MAHADTHGFLPLDEPLTLPAQTVATADSALRLSPELPIATVLIVDDFAPWRALVRRILAVHPDWKVMGEACDGPDAVRKATEFQPDIILLDITMPGLSGIEAAKLIRQQSPASAIVFLTTNDDQHIRDAALAVGCARYVLKVNARADLCPAIDACLRRS
jgi:DNA-binding NarL/FixJ family response regulator